MFDTYNKYREAFSFNNIYESYDSLNEGQIIKLKKLDQLRQVLEMIAGISNVLINGNLIQFKYKNRQYNCKYQDFSIRYMDDKYENVIKDVDFPSMAFSYSFFDKDKFTNDLLFFIMQYNEYDMEQQAYSEEAKDFKKRFSFLPYIFFDDKEEIDIKTVNVDENDNNITVYFGIKDKNSYKTTCYFTLNDLHGSISITNITYNTSDTQRVVGIDNYIKELTTLRDKTNSIKEIGYKIKNYKDLEEYSISHFNKNFNYFKDLLDRGLMKNEDLNQKIMNKDSVDSSIFGDLF